MISEYQMAHKAYKLDLEVKKLKYLELGVALRKYVEIKNKLI